MPAGDRAAGDAVRRALRERGYLQNAVGRFVLRDLVRDVTRARAARAAIKAAVVGGPVLSALLCAVAVSGPDPAVARADLPLLFVYYLPLVVAVLVALDLVVAAGVAFLARRRAPRAADTWIASLGVALPVLGYLAWLWWPRRTDGGWPAHVGFAVLAVATGWLLAWLGGLVSLTAMVRRSGRGPGGRPLRWFVVPASLAAGAAAIALFVPEGRVPGDAGFAVDPPSRRLVVVGVDGLEAGLLQDHAETPAGAEWLARLEGGAVHPIAPRPGAEPAEVWTTMLTGHAPAIHGVRDAGVEHMAGLASDRADRPGPLPLERALRALVPSRVRPLSRADRRVPAVWEILALREEVIAVGWWSSWPASREGRGYLVTDRFLPRLLAGAPPRADVRPASLDAVVRGRFPAIEAELRAALEAALPADVDARVRGFLWDAWLTDGFHLAVAEVLRGDPGVSTVMIYLPGLDLLRTRLLREREPGPAAAAAVGAYLGLLGERLGPWLPADGASDWVLVGDPGRAGRAGESEGLLAVHGPGAPPGCVGGPLDARAIAPILLQRRGFPRSETMPAPGPGGCLAGAGEQGVVRAFPMPPRRIEPGVVGPDPAALDRLRSLGYIE